MEESVSFFNWLRRIITDRRVRVSQFAGLSRSQAFKVFSSSPPACKHCGQTHHGQCNQLPQK